MRRHVFSSLIGLGLLLVAGSASPAMAGCYQQTPPGGPTPAVCPDVMSYVDANGFAQTVDSAHPLPTSATAGTITGITNPVGVKGVDGSTIATAGNPFPVINEAASSNVVATPQCTGVINITQTSTTDVHTFTNRGYICSIVLVSATAQSIGIDEGTGTTCETNGTALIGVSSTASATPTMAVAANGGFSSISGIPWLKTQATGDHLCILQSGAGNVSGVITYQDAT